jgi:hypothetical protein
VADISLDIGWSLRPFAGGQPHTDRGVLGRLGSVPGKRFQHLVAIRLQGVDAQIDGRPPRQRRALTRHPGGKGARKGGLQPIGYVAGNAGRDGTQVGAQQALPFRLAQGCQRIGRTIGAGDDGRRRQRQRPAGGGQRQGPRRIRLHACCQRPSAAQGVVDEVADGGPIARAGEAMRLAPIRQRDRGGTVPLEHVLQDLDGGPDLRARPHEFRQARR